MMDNVSRETPRYRWTADNELVRVQGTMHELGLQETPAKSRRKPEWTCGMCNHVNPARFRSRCQRCGAERGYGLYAGKVHSCHVVTKALYSAPTTGVCHE